MIRIRSREQFRKAAVRARNERMSLRRNEPNVYEIINRARGHSYLARFLRLGANVFGKCTCEAGTPSTNRAPQVCKHLFAAVITHRAVVRVRRALKGKGPGDGATRPLAPLLFAHFPEKGKVAVKNTTETARQPLKGKG